jgi:hypothetical protein
MARTSVNMAGSGETQRLRRATAKCGPFRDGRPAARADYLRIGQSYKGKGAYMQVGGAPAREDSGPWSTWAA